MKLSIKQLIRVISFLILGMAFLFCLQGVMSKKWFYPAVVDAPVDMLKEFYQLSENTEIQAAFLGTSHSEYVIDPMAIYEHNGIVTYNLSFANQYADVSSFLLAELLERQHPSVITFDASRLFHNDFEEQYEPWYRAALDNTPLSLNKVKLAKEYASNYPVEKQVGSFLGVFFPIYRYHDRWSELSAIDFSPRQVQNCYRKGYYLTSRMVPYDLDPEWINEEAQSLIDNVGWTQKIVDRTQESFTEDSRLYEPVINETARSQLERMKQLCDENGVRLMLLKIPAVGDPQYYSGAWTRSRSEATKKLAEELGVDFLDLFYDVDLGIDWTKDTLDGGKHLNYGGASKISAFLAEYLEKECGLTGRKSQAYEEDLPLYRAMCDVTELQMVNDLTAYLDMIARYDDVTVFLSVADDMMSNMPKEGRAALRRLGLQTDFDSLSYSDAFLAVIENGTVRCEMSSNRRISYEDVLRNGQAYLISSCGYLVGTESKIVINGCDYSLNQRGINIVVLDNASGKVLDSAAFDTWDVPGHQSAIRNNPKTEKFLREYEEYLMVQDAKNGIGA